MSASGESTRPSAGALEIRSPLLAFPRVCRRTGAIRRACEFRVGGDRERRLQVRYGFREHSWLRIISERRAEASFDEVADATEHAREGGESLLLRPGANRVQVVLNTDSSNFPYDRFRGRVYFDDAERELPEHWLEISFEEIEELRDFPGFAAIDLGTCNSMLSLYHLQRDAVGGEPWSPILEDGSGEVPSAVFVRDLARLRRGAEGSCAVGRAALAEYRAHPGHDPRALQLGLKRRIGLPRVMVADSHGAGGQVDPVVLLSALARSLRERSQDHEDVQARLPRLTVTYPPTWDLRQIEHWREVFLRLGFGEDELDLSLDEASAAGLFHVYRWIRDGDSRRRLVQDLTHSWQQVQEGKRSGDRYRLRLLSFDFGGGTVDIASISVLLTLFEDVIRVRLELEGSDSLNFGGDQVTLAVFRLLKRRIALALADPLRFRGGDEDARGEEAAIGQRASVESGLFLLPGETRFFEAPRRDDETAVARRTLGERWDDLSRRIAQEELPRELDDAVDALVPTRFWRSPTEPLSPRAKRNFGWLWDRAEGLKRELFLEANRRAREVALRLDEVEDLRGGIPLGELPDSVAELPSELEDERVAVSIAEIYRMISPPLERAVLRARRLTGDEGVDRVVLSGQSCWIPLVRRLFMQPRGDGGFGLPPAKIEFDEDHAKSAVCMGACLLPVLRDALVGFDVDVSDFKANLLSTIGYRSPLLGDRVLFPAGPIDDLTPVEERPDPGGFVRHLTITTGDEGGVGEEGQVLGQFDFTGPGEALVPYESHARHTREKLALEGPFPDSVTLQELAERSPGVRVRIVSQLRDWPERALISWLEQGAEPGTARAPRFRYYLSRNRNLFAVRDVGDADPRLFRLQMDERPDARAASRDNPFSGHH